VRGILAEGRICHLAFADAGQPHVIPTFYAVVGNELFVHGSTANRVLRALADGGEACVEVTLVDGLVLARSAFHHSMNYRSVIIYGRARAVDDADEKLVVMRELIEKMVPGRWEDVRAPNREEFARTLVLGIPIDEASAKIRRGPPVDDDEDYAMDCWAGVIPLAPALGAPAADPKLAKEIALPAYVREYTPPGGTA
jgi:nitroimidazol reductase NimA-like FMN-containing flavoprotein (pyridoxamine 5'-phosphate oxidase superfamily)